MNKKENNSVQKGDKYKEFTVILNLYVKALLKGKSVHDYLLGKGYKSVAIYGMSFLGDRILEDMHHSELDIKYGIDIMADYIDSDIPIYHPNDELSDVDVIIVTTIFQYENILNVLKNKGMTSDILELKNIVFSL